MDFSAILKAKQAWSTFKGNHPKFEPFLNDVKQRGIKEGTILGLTVEYPDGTQVKTNLRVTESDLELIGVLKSLTDK